MQPTPERIMLAEINYQVEGFHCWPEAEGVRAYLNQRHRHMFHYTVKLEVFHHDREVEYHDLLDFCRANSASGEMGRMSCEDMATQLLNLLVTRYPGRMTTISVLEDGECGAILSYAPETETP